jgi:hypothetical protein
MDCQASTQHVRGDNRSSIWGLCAPGSLTPLYCRARERERTHAHPRVASRPPDRGSRRRLLSPCKPRSGGQTVSECSSTLLRIASSTGECALIGALRSRAPSRQHPSPHPLPRCYCARRNFQRPQHSPSTPLPEAGVAMYQSSLAPLNSQERSDKELSARSRGHTMRGASFQLAWSPAPRAALTRGVTRYLPQGRTGPAPGPSRSGSRARTRPPRAGRSR